MKAAKYAPADLNNGFVVAIEIVAKAGGGRCRRTRT
jgi:hypothetical protein